MPALPTISVVTAVFNGRETIASTIDSVAAQSYPGKEHVIQDGASTDGTLDVVRQTASEIVRVHSEPDRGIYDAFNRGLARCSGDVITFLGSDDCYAHAEVLKRVAAAFADESVDVVFGDVRFVRRDGRVVRRYDSRRFRPSRLSWGVMPAHTATFVRRRIYDMVGGFDPSFRIAGDYEWFLRAFARPIRYVHLPETLVRMQTGGISTSGPAATWTITREFHRACRANRVRTSYARLLSRLPRKALERLRT